MNIIKLFLFVWVVGTYAAAGDEGIEVRLMNKLDGTITIPVFGGLVLAPNEAQSVLFPANLTKFSFLYSHQHNTDLDVEHRVEGIHLTSLFERSELQLVPDKDAGVILKYNGLQLHELKARQRLVRQETQPLLQVASADRVHRRKHRKQASLQQLKK